MEFYANWIPRALNRSCPLPDQYQGPNGRRSFANWRIAFQPPCLSLMRGFGLWSSSPPTLRFRSPRSEGATENRSVGGGSKPAAGGECSCRTGQAVGRGACRGGRIRRRGVGGVALLYKNSRARFCAEVANCRFEIKQVALDGCLRHPELLPGGAVARGDGCA